MRDNKIFFPYYNSEKFQKLRVFFQDDPPFSFVDEKRRIRGVEGNLLDEFTKKIERDYEIVNKGTSNYSINSVAGSYELSLNRYFRLAHQHAILIEEQIQLFETDGVCFLGLIKFTPQKS